MIGSSQMAMMAAQAAFGILGPVILFLVLKNNYKMKTESFVIGCVIMLIFAMALESGIHRLVLGSAAGDTIVNNTLYYAIYGGLMAALFEEAGRYVAFHVFMKHLHGDDRNAIMYGAGHGSLEAFMTLGMTGISNFAMASQINSGSLPQYTGEEKEMLDQAVAALIDTSAATYLLGMMERVSAVILQIALSIIVWQTVKQVKGRIMYLFLAMLLHFAVDSTTVLMANALPIFVMELIIFAMAIVILALGMRLYKRGK